MFPVGKIGPPYCQKNAPSVPFQHPPCPRSECSCPCPPVIPTSQAQWRLSEQGQQVPTPSGAPTPSHLKCFYFLRFQDTRSPEDAPSRSSLLSPSLTHAPYPAQPTLSRRSWCRAPSSSSAISFSPVILGTTFSAESTHLQPRPLL